MSPPPIPKLNLTVIDQNSTPASQEKFEPGPALENIVGISMVFAGVYALTTAVRKYPCRHHDAPPVIGVAGMFLLGMGLPVGSCDTVKTVAGALGLAIACAMP